MFAHWEKVDRLQWCVTGSGPDEHVRHIEQVWRAIKEKPVNDKIMLQLLKAGPEEEHHRC